MNFYKKVFLTISPLLWVTITLSAQNSQHYRVHDSIIVKTPVSPGLYSNFIELGFGRSENARAELLYNRSFEEDHPVTCDWVQFTRPKPEMEDWWHSGYEEQAWYIHRGSGDTTSRLVKNRSYWPAAHSKTNISVANRSKTEPVYLAQNGVFIRKNVGYHFSGYFNDGTGFSADKLSKKPIEITIGLYKENDFSKPISEKTLIVNTVQFNEFKLDLPPTDFEGRTTFAIKIPANKRVGVDLLSLIPDDNIKGWRRDVVEMMKTNVPAPIIRFPGGCYASFYNWRDGIGDPFYRPVDFNSYWSSFVMNDIGTIEFVELCREIKSEPQICIPLMFKTVENAVDWLAFCNAPHHALREKYGHPEPLNVKYWEMENEMYRSLDAITYAYKCVEYSKALKAVDPSIKVIMGDYFVFNSKLAEMLEIAGPYIDFVNNRGGSMKEMAADIALVNTYNLKHNRDIKLCHSEFRAPVERNSGGVDGLNKAEVKQKESLQNMSVRWSYGMSVMDQMIHYQNFGGMFSFAQFTNYNDTWGENLINTTKEGVYLSSAGRAMEFLNRLPIAFPLAVDNKSIDPDIVLQAAWDTEKKHFTLLVLNFSGIEKNKQFDISELRAKFVKEQKHFSVYAEKLTDFNSPANKNKIITEDNSVIIAKTRFNIKLKPYSANAWVFSVKE
jgi:alpha-L-arabinofuranosidase